MEVDLTNVKSGVMSRTGGSGTRGSGTRGSGTRGSAQVEGVCRWRKGGVARGRSGVGHGKWKCPKPLVDLTEEVEQEQEEN